MTITAPFRFARINRKVWFPKWGNLVSHDVPFGDGLCGTIDLKITTQTPLLVGGRHTPGEPGTVHPFVDGDGKWAIPGSSIQGMIRQILEVAAFGKLGPVVNDRRFGVRDISPGKTADIMYRGRLVNHVKTGWLVRTAKGPRIHHCSMDRIPIAELEKRFPAAGHTLKSRSDAKKRLGNLVGGNRNLNLLETEWDGQPATLVITGKTNEGISDHPSNKHRNPKKSEFVFFGKSRAEIAVLSHALDGEVVKDDVWRDFLLIHAPEKGSGGVINPNWDFWQGEFKAGNPVPVFYIEESGSISALGMAQMFKLAMQLSTHEMLGHSSADHLDQQKFDLPSLIFGASGEKGAKDSWFAHNLKRRAAFDLFRGSKRDEARERETAQSAQTLLAPKPSYYPIYVRQDQAPSTNRPYAAYHNMTGQTEKYLSSPELAGVKVWPVSGQTRLASTSGQASISNHLRSVPACQHFSGCLRVHNLRPAELGALLWALTYGQEGVYTHRLGGAKPLGFGEIQIGIGKINLIPNRTGDSVPDMEALIACFVAAVDAFYGGNWKDSPQVTALLRAAQPGTNGLAYLSGHQGYKAARDQNQIMDGYADTALEFPRSGPPPPIVSTIDLEALVVGQRYASGPVKGVLRKIMADGRRVELRLDNGQTQVVARVGLRQIS